MRILAHLDLDAFFAAVEELENPELRDKPLVVGGDPQSRGVVSTANYAARKFGIHSAMSAAEALRRCPDAVFLRPGMRCIASTRGSCGTRSARSSRGSSGPGSTRVISISARRQPTAEWRGLWYQASYTCRSISEKSIRTSKYGVLVILLTFVALFLVEITQKVRIHPFQYILIGAALTIYYTLLLSFSEHIGYNPAYIIASLATVTLIGLYSVTFLRNTKLTILFSLLLVIFYAFIFVIILQQDLSLLLGSIGLFLIIGLLMYFSRKVNWYQ